MATPSTPLRLSVPASRALSSATARRAFFSSSSSQRTPTVPLPTTCRVHRQPALLSNNTHNNNNSSSSSSSTSSSSSCCRKPSCNSYSPIIARAIHTTGPANRQRRPLAHNREEVPDQPPPTDFGQLDVLGSLPVPATAVVACRDDGFSLHSGVHIRGGSGALLVGGEAFAWRPWELPLRRGDGEAASSSSSSSSAAAAAGGGTTKGGRAGLVNAKGQWEVAEEAFAVLGAVWPRPDLLILGLGPEMRPLSPATRRAISNLGMRVEVLDTRNAASQYNMLATERGVDDVAAALIPIGWKDGAR